MSLKTDHNLVCQHIRDTITLIIPFRIDFILMNTQPNSWTILTNQRASHDLKQKSKMQRHIKKNIAKNDVVN